MTECGRCGRPRGPAVTVSQLAGKKKRIRRRMVTVLGGPEIWLCARCAARVRDLITSTALR